jgi:hypothetical protein
MAPAVAAFNERLAAGGVPWRFPTSSVPVWLPRLPDRNIYQQFFLALDGPGTVRGGYSIKHQLYRIGGQERSIGQIALPLSEGVIDRRYAMVGTQLLLHALRQQPLMYALGMGGQNEPITHLVRAAGWRVTTLPFDFQIVRPTRFLRNVEHLRRSKLRARLLDAAAASGLGWLACRATQLLMAKRPPRMPNLEFEEIDEFGDWADDLWAECAPEYRYIAVRDAATLRILYPKGNRRFIRVRIRQANRLVGWAVLLATDLANHKQFGNMRLGSIVDVLSLPEEAEKVIVAAERLLYDKRVDLIVSNQAHGRWHRALSRGGFLGGPSNFLLATSKKLTELLQASNIADDQMHINRGDGDGPINL